MNHLEVAHTTPPLPSFLEHIGHVVMMSVSGYRGRRFKPRHQYVVSLSKTLYPHCFSRLSCEMSTGGNNLVKGVQCYEIFEGIVLKNHAFFPIAAINSNDIYCLHIY